MTPEEMGKEIHELTRKLSDPWFLSNRAEAKKAHSRLQKLEKQSALAVNLERIKKDKNDAEEMLKSEDKNLCALAEEELQHLIREEEQILRDAKILGEEETSEPIPDDLIMEIRAGAGGEEAALFAEELFSMYLKFAEKKKWDVNILSSSESSLGGFKEIIFEIDGEGAYKMLKQESGVHRIQRIPETEKQGRIHTSTASVAVLPKVKEIDAEIKPRDLKIEFYRSSGAGGQNVNKVETAVRITHIPTGYVVTSQEGRSQLKNRERAMSLLRSKIYEAEREAEAKKIALERKLQIGTADRSEKIRTYNVPQDRITDHRINQNFHNIEKIMEGNLESIIDAFQQEART